MSSFYLLLNRSHYVEGTNMMRYDFPSDLKLGSDYECALISMSFYNCFNNISSSLGNNKNCILFRFPHFTGPDTYTMHDYVLSYDEDAFMSIDDINLSIQSFFIRNGLYIQRAGNETDNGYFVSLLPNENTYKTDVFVYRIPTLLDITEPYSLPPDHPPIYNPSMSSTALRVSPEIFIQNELFGKLLGFRYGLLCASTTSTSYQDISTVALKVSSQKAPAINAVNSITVRSSLISNQWSVPSDLLSMVTLSARFGAINSFSAPFPIYSTCSGAQQRSVSFLFYDENQLPLVFQDRDMSLTVHIKPRPRAAIDK